MAETDKKQGLPFTRRPLIYGRAKGKALSPRQQKLFAGVLPRVAVPQTKPLDPYTVFSCVCAVHLEIGFGGGEHLIARARQNPDTGFIGCEPFLNGVAKTLAAIEEHDVGNVRLHHGDARDVLDRLETASLDRVYLLYPDPWPKTRQNKRRFVGADTLESLARVIRPGGILEIASDIPDYIVWTLREIAADGHFTECAGNDRATPPDAWPGTRYEAKALREGRTPCYLEFARRS
ncbi:tRNA (guanosine(46)-N7)-methyltransferase TrmB [Pyruvatibacter sp.]|uniref:tRNA (guanosine(46)-N7)-methyltransferase TrmB n=1 Tax=Pyruvatibacter sp. TaxID=1981328 RepID=UPI0032ED4192